MPEAQSHPARRNGHVAVDEAAEKVVAFDRPGA
jgi:hypothetical protein